MRVFVTLIRAKNLPTHHLKQCTSYCTISLKGGGPVYRSNIIQRCPNPDWGQRFEFVAPPEENSVEINIMVVSSVTKDLKIGFVSIPVKPTRVLKKAWYTIEGPKDSDLKVEIDVKEQENPLHLFPSCIVEIKEYISDNPKPKPFKIHHNALVGIGTSQGERYKAFPTYEITLFDSDKIFKGKIHPWNPEYDKAKTIFGPGPQASVIRAAIRAQFASLYRDGLLRTEKGELNSGEDFLKLINYGVKNATRRVFTYVIVGNNLRFSETGASFFKDFMSKHATHADAAAEVTYSGEFQIRTEGHSHILTIDNNSGTYSPDPADLPLLQKLIVCNFPDLDTRIETLHFKDPALENYKKILESEVLQSEMGFL